MRYLLAFMLSAAVFSVGAARADDLLKPPNTGMVGATRLGGTEIQNPPHESTGVGQSPSLVSRHNVRPIAVEPAPTPAPAPAPVREEAPLPDEVNPERFQREPAPQPTEQLAPPNQEMP